MKILAVIPARGGSKGIPGKNIKNLGGKPLIQYTIDLAKESGMFHKVMVSTEDEDIARVSKNCGADVPFLRSPDLARDHSSSVDVIVDLMNNDEIAAQDYDAVCLLQCTTPFRDLEEVKQAIEKFKDGTTDSLITVRSIPDHFNPHWTFEADASDHLQIATGDVRLITRRQELPKAYYRDGSVYLTRTKALLGKKSLYGKSIGYFENQKTAAINLDTMEDWEEAERVLNL